MKYRRKPVVIEAIQINTVHDLEHTPALFRIYKKSEDFQWEIYNKPHDSWIAIKVGDYIRIDNPDDIYPIEQETFHNTYEEVEES